jgi:hypothetical protein
MTHPVFTLQIVWCTSCRSRPQLRIALAHGAANLLTSAPPKKSIWMQAFLPTSLFSVLPPMGALSSLPVLVEILNLELRLLLVGVSTVVPEANQVLTQNSSPVMVSSLNLASSWSRSSEPPPPSVLQYNPRPPPLALCQGGGC